MNFRVILCAIGFVAMFVCGAGCGKQQTSRPKLAPTVLSSNTIAAIHWIGRHKVELSANAYYFSRIWAQAESVRLEAQTMDRFSTGFWQWVLGEDAGGKISSAVLRPLLGELTQAESYLEIQAATNMAPSFVLATRVNPIYAGLWQTNLADAVELLADASAVSDPSTHGWTVQCAKRPEMISFKWIGDWAIVAFGPRQNPLADDISRRVLRDDVPFVSSGTNLWLEAILDPARLTATFPSVFSGFSSLVSGLKSFQFNLSGDGANVITQARLTLARPWTNCLESWQMPVPLLHEPLTSFTAARGIQPLLESLGWWDKLPRGTPPPPDQLFLWSLAGSGYRLYLAAPSTDAHQCVTGLGNALLHQANPWLAGHGFFTFVPSLDGNGVTSGNLPDLHPFVHYFGNHDENGWIYAGLTPDDQSNRLPPPEGMIQDILHRNELMYYGWEITGPRLQPTLQVAQTARQLTHFPILPLTSTSLAWLGTMVPRLGTSATMINRSGPSELTFYRRSTLGFTAPELQILTDWLESPQFPKGLHSFLASPDKQ